MDGLSAPPLITPEELEARIGAPDVVVLDATTTWPGGPQPRVTGSITGAVFFDIEAISDRKSDLPHMLPSEAEFGAAMARLGLSNGDLAIIYDRHGVLSAPRAWWSLRAMGHERVVVLDGGLPRWIDEGRPTDPGPAAAEAPTPGRFEAMLDPMLVRTYSQVRAVVDEGGAQILDARSNARFTGKEKEARRGVRPGHMPGAINAPYREFLTDDGRLAPPANIEQALRSRGVDATQPMIASCGSGVTACIIALACKRVGYDDVAIYDGSWAEWGARRGAPIKKGSGE